MTAFTVRRGQFRAALASLPPHAGKESDDTPHHGRVRVIPRATDVLLWASDGITAAAVRVDVEDHFDDGAELFDLPADEVRAALAVFKGPTNPDARMMWDDQLLTIEVRAEHVSLTEEGLFPGRSLTVRRVVEAGEDKSVDVAALVLTAQGGEPAPEPVAAVDLDRLMRFHVATKAWESPLRVAFVQDPSVALVRIGDRLIGVCPVWRVLDDDRVASRTVESRWTADLTPLRRPERVEVPTDVVDDLKAAASVLIRDGAGVRLTVVKAGDPS